MRKKVRLSDSSPATVGVISDTHGLLRSEVLDILRGCSFIIHAGDIGDLEILKQLSEIAPVTAVRGNVDTTPWTGTIPRTNVLEVDDVSIYVLHNLQDLDLKLEAAGFSAVIYGHTHVPRREVKNGVLYFNPGSAGPKRFKLPSSVGKLTISRGKIAARIIEI